MSGKKCGRLTVISESPIRTNDGRIQWNCTCECGNSVTVMGKHLRSGHTQSCGCYKRDITSEHMKTHGKSRSKVYVAWTNIKARCYSPKSDSFCDYGAKGIGMHEAFKYDFEAFYAEIGDPPDDSREWSIDRIDYIKSYEPGNMRWATASQQSQNRGKASNNTSGYTGVSYMNNGYNEYWVAHWHTLQGLQQSKCFSIKKLGYEEAKQKAIAARAEAILMLNQQGADYSETHGL